MSAGRDGIILRILGIPRIDLTIILSRLGSLISQSSVLMFASMRASRLVSSLCSRVTFENIHVGTFTLRSKGYPGSVSTPIKKTSMSGDKDD
jgi:hypothetical protein